MMRAMYPAFLGSKLWLKLNTPLGRCANESALELADEPMPATEMGSPSKPS